MFKLRLKVVPGTNGELLYHAGYHRYSGTLGGWQYSFFTWRSLWLMKERGHNFCSKPDWHKWYSCCNFRPWYGYWSHGRSNHFGVSWSQDNSHNTFACIPEEYFQAVIDIFIKDGWAYES